MNIWTNNTVVNRSETYYRQTKQAAALRGSQVHVTPGPCHTAQFYSTHIKPHSAWMGALWLGVQTRVRVDAVGSNSKITPTTFASGLLQLSSPLPTPFSRLSLPVITNSPSFSPFHIKHRPCLFVPFQGAVQRSWRCIRDQKSKAKINWLCKSQDRHAVNWLWMTALCGPSFFLYSSFIKKKSKQNLVNLECPLLSSSL